jgi:hypothetical protein
VAIVAGKSDARVIPIKQAKTLTFENTYDHVPPSPGFRILRGRPTEGAFFCALLTRLSALLQMPSKSRPQSVAAANLASSCFDDAVLKTSTTCREMDRDEEHAYFGGHVTGTERSSVG